MVSTQRGDPHVVLRERPAKPAEALAHAGVGDGDGRVDDQDLRTLDQLGQEPLELLAVPRALQAEAVLADHDGRKREPSGPGEDTEERPLFVEERRDGIGVEREVAHHVALSICENSALIASFTGLVSSFLALPASRLQAGVGRALSCLSSASAIKSRIEMPRSAAAAFVRRSSSSGSSRVVFTTSQSVAATLATAPPHRVRPT